jgi:putative transcriptional regulator
MKAELFDKLVGALDEAVEYHRGAKLNLRTTTLPDPPEPVTSETVKRVRDAVNASQAVFARYLNVSTKTVQAWEGGTRPVAGPALVLFRIAQHHPHFVFPVATQSSQVSAARRSEAVRRHTAASKASPKRIAVPAHVARKVAAKGTRGTRRA